jgi:protein arginine kinase activator
MRCQQCNEAEATVHLKEVTDGKRQELHLCETCAREKGFHLVVEHNKLTIATQFIWMAENLYPETSSKVGAVQCPSCGLRYSQFSRAGRVGCAGCYEAFATQLQKVLHRVHGATRHKGRVPVSSAPGALRGATGVLEADGRGGTAPGETTEAPGTAGFATSEGTATPLSDLTPDELAARLQEMEAQLRRAVRTEAYEEAARLRDEILRLQGGQP